MKIFKIAFLAVFLSILPLAKAQKVGVVDTQYLLNQMPEYKDAEVRMNTQIQTWQKDIENLQSEFDRKKAAFENEKVLLVGDQLRAREKEVADLDKNIKTTISLRFGTNGEISKLRQNLTQPFQDQIWNAMQSVAEKNGVGILIDKNSTNVIFLQKRYDLTDKVLDVLLGKTTTKSPAKTKKK